MKTYEIESLGHCSRIVEMSASGSSTVIGDFSTAMDAQVWLDNHLSRLHSTGTGLSVIPEKAGD